MSNKEVRRFSKPARSPWYVAQRLQPSCTQSSCYRKRPLLRLTEALLRAVVLICVIVPGVENPFFGSSRKLQQPKQKNSVTRL